MRQPTLPYRSSLRRRAIGPERPGVSAVGFSLTELMISLGILAVGLAMIASLFPAAVEINRRSTREILGSIICENGLAVAKVRFASGAVTSPPKGNLMMQILADDYEQDYLTRQMCRFPDGQMSSPYGFVLMYRYIDADDDEDTEEGHQLVAMSYKRRAEPTEAPDPYNDHAVRIRTGGFQYYGTPIPTVKVRASSDLFRIGTPVIDRYSGEYALAREAVFTATGSGSGGLGEAVLDRKVLYTLDGSDQYKLFTLQEHGQDRFSPALSAMVTRVPLNWN